MPEYRPLAEPHDVTYLYDGGLAGFFTCVYESVYSRQLPTAIEVEAEAQPNLLMQKRIVTDLQKAQRVRASIPAKVSSRGLELIETVFLSCLPQKEVLLLRFLLRAYREGGKLLFSLGDPDLAPLLRAEKHLHQEAHLLRGFVRFADSGEALTSAISPKNYVLPFIAPHFITRLSGENFMIYDRTHRVALIYQDRTARIMAVDQVEFPDITATEELYQSLWKQFYRSIAIESRYNPKCRMSHMPKRYWENMIEVQELL